MEAHERRGHLGDRDAKGGLRRRGHERRQELPLVRYRPNHPYSPHARASHALCAAPEPLTRLTRAPRRENKKTKPDEPETGACYYGADTNNFPLKRGLSLHGGIRAAAVTAEHGLYFDTEWPITFEESDDGKSQTIVFQLTDDDEQRAKCALPDDPPGNPVTPGPFSVGGFAQPNQINVDGYGVVEPMSLYPTTNCIFTARITLRAGEGALSPNSNPQP